MRAPRLLSQSFATPAPQAAIEIAVDRVSAVMLRRGPKPEVLGCESEVLPTGTVVAGASSRNIVGKQVVIDAIRAVLERLPRKVSKVGLIVPDRVARVSIIKFDQTPNNRSDLDKMIQWRISRSIPFTLANAQLSHTPGAAVSTNGREFVAVVMRRDITEEYEGVCLASGVRPGIVDLASLNLINLLIVNRNVLKLEDWLVLHAAPGYNSIAIMRGEALLFFRTSGSARSGDVAELVHQTGMYYEDRLKGEGISKVILESSVDGDEGVTVEIARRCLTERFEVPVLEVATSELGVRIPVELSSMRIFAAPVGLLIRERQSAIQGHASN